MVGVAWNWFDQYYSYTWSGSYGIGTATVTAKNPAGAAAPTTGTALAAPTVPPLEPTNASLSGISDTPMPLSGGQRRINGRVIDRIVGALGAAGSGSGVMDVSAGYPLFPEAGNTLTRITAGAVTIYDPTGVVHPGVDSVTWYPGSETQGKDPLFVAVHGATKTPAYLGQMHAVVKFNSYAAWNNQEPPLTLWIADDIGGSRFAAWGGAWDPAALGANLALSDSDKTATYSGVNTLSDVRGTVSRSSGRYYCEFDPGAIGDGAPGIAHYKVGIVGATAAVVLAADGYLWTTGITPKFLFAYTASTRIGMLVDFNIDRMWFTNDGVTFYDGEIAPPDPITGTGGIDISAVTSGGSVVPVFVAFDTGDICTIVTTADLFLYTPPGVAGEGTRAAVLTASAAYAAGDQTVDVLVSDNIDEIVPGVIFLGNWNWLDFARSDGMIANHDYFVDGATVQIKRVDYESPTVDFASIPVNHRLALSDRGSTESRQDGERKKPKAVFHSYYDVSRQFQPSMVPARSEANDTNEELRITTPWVMEAADASLGAAIALGKAELETEEHEQYLPPLDPYLTMQPVDVVNFTNLSKTYQAKVRSVTLESDWGLKTGYHSLLELADDLTVPGFAGVATDPFMPREPITGGDFAEPSNSGLVALLFEDI